LKKWRLELLARLLTAALWSAVAVSVHAQTMLSEAPTLKLERIEDGLWLSTQLNFELPAVVEDALYKGIPLYFVSEVDVMRERWYWTNRKIVTVRRHLRLAYQPLTRRWRLNVSAGDVSAVAQGLALTQNFDSVQDSMAAVRRISHWRVADAADIETDVKHIVEFRFRLDVTQLPRPLQIGTLGQSDWHIAMAATKSLMLDSGK